jgi:hypothetical protein
LFRNQIVRKIFSWICTEKEITRTIEDTAPSVNERLKRNAGRKREKKDKLSSFCF